MQLPPFDQPGRFYKGNLHTHSTRSDGTLSPGAVLAAYRERGYDFLSLTDHFIPRFDFPLVDTRAWPRVRWRWAHSSPSRIRPGMG